MEKRCTGLVLVALVSAAQIAQGQSRGIDVGVVTDVAALGRSDRCPLSRSGRPSADALRIVSGGSGEAENAKSRDPIFTKDRLLARRFVDARIDVNSTTLGTGILSLIPELGRCAAPVAGVPALGIALDNNWLGSYRLESRRETLRGRSVDRLLFAVEHGGAVVYWDRNRNAAHPMSIIALGEEIALTGTTVAVVVDSIARRALLFVGEGAVAILGAAARPIGSGSVYELRSGQQPRQLGAVSRELVSEISYHSQTVFEPPLPRTSSAWKRIGIGVASVGAAYAVYSVIDNQRNRDGPQPLPNVRRNRNGTIVIRIPL